MSSRREVFSVGRPPQLDIRLPSGSLDVHADAEDSVIVDIEGRHADEFSVTQSGGTITVLYDGRRSIVGSSHDVTISAPADTKLTARVASADVTTDGDLGDVLLATASGDVHIACVTGSLDAKTASGRMTVEQASGPVRVRTASGNISIQASDQDASITTASGNIRIGDAKGDVSLKTASGRVTVDEFDGDVCSVKSVSGGVKVGVPTERTVRFDLTSLSGRIDVPSEPGQSGVADKELRIRVKTVSGNVAIKTAG